MIFVIDNGGSGTKKGFAGISKMIGEIMKALNYLQMWHLNTFDAYKYNEWLAKIEEKSSNLSDWNYFLSQKFEPEMITKYFEEAVIPNQIYPPRTLDEFITDCQRAGIELELKEKK